MKILHIVTNADLGGAPRVVTELANRAARDGHACGVVSVAEGPMWVGLFSEVEKLPLRNLRRAISPLRDIATIFELRRLFKRWKPDIIHLHSSKAGVLGRLAAGKAENVVYTIHGFDTILKSYRVFLPLERLLARRCAALVPVSEYDFRNMKKAGIGGNLKLVRNGATNRGQRKGANASVRESFERARSKSAKIILTIARMEPPKRVDLFVEAAKRFAPDEAQFFWIGNTKSPDGDLPQNVEFLEEVAEAGDYINYCDIFMLLSDYEGLPMSVLEAMSCEKPIVASKVGGIPEALVEGAGSLVENEAAAVESALRRYFVGDISAKAGAAAKARYESSFSAEAMWANYSALYRAIIARDRSSFESATCKRT